MTVNLSGFVGETSPGLALVLAGLVGALASYNLMRKPSKGRAQGSISYLAGLMSGLTAVVSFVTLLGAGADPSSVVAPGLMGAFFGPFAGMLRAKWDGPVKKRRPPPWLTGSPAARRE